VNLLIVSHTPHYRLDKGLVGWGPTVREIDYLARLFANVVHVAPLHEGPAPGSSLPYCSKQVELRAVRPAGGPAFLDKVGILWACLDYMKTIRQVMPETDVVHVRCPANISLAAILMLAFYRNPPLRWFKYAGNWRPEGREALSYTLQRYWLRKGFSKGLVTVNGSWSDQPVHVHSFFNPCLTKTELLQARALGRQKNLALPLSLLFVGRVEESKGVGRLLQIAKELKARNLAFDIHVVGDGPEKVIYERWSSEQGLPVSFHGWLPKPGLAKFYSQAHLFLFPSSASEGWPKVLSEAMAYGAVPLAGAVSSIPQILQETKAGLALPPLNVQAYVDATMYYLANPHQWQAASKAGMDAGDNFNYESYVKSLGALFKDTWGVDLKVPSQISRLPLREKSG
jgi:glycosyltransferase involved in cell wall biosynthesis